MEIIFTKKNKNRVHAALEGTGKFQKLTTEEWHQFVQNYNYDDGLAPLLWLAEQPTCDRGTALCLYWYLQPDYYCNHVVADSDDYKLIKLIEHNFLSGFYQLENFSFDPTEVFLSPTTNTICIPVEMQKKNGGITFSRIDCEFAFLRYPNDKESKSIEKKIKNAYTIIDQSKLTYVDSSVKELLHTLEQAVKYWMGKDSGKLKLENLSFLWLEALVKNYGWEWMVWDWETGSKICAGHPNKKLVCMSDTIIAHTLSGFQRTAVIQELFDDLKGVSDVGELSQKPYSGNGLLFSSNHLRFNV